MKVLILNLLFLFSTGFLFSQITITDGNGTPINNGDVRIFNTDGDEANLVTLITNNSSSQIKIQLLPVSITGANGAGMEFCIGACYFGMTAGTIYPSNPQDTATYRLDAGATSGVNEIHFHHHIQEGDPDVTEYVLKIYEVGNETGDFVQFKYKYDANYTNIDDINKSSISIFPNPASNFVNVNIPENIQNPEISISNIIGKTVYNSVLNDTKNNINIKNLSSGIYFVSVISNDAVIDTKKLIKK